MSLSFVSKSVQTSTDDGQFVEEAIEGASTANESSEFQKPLFEQLRANKDQADAEDEEYKKSIMRGTLALDEEDAAHLDYLRRQEQEKQDELRRQTGEELAAFRAARADRSEVSVVEEQADQSAAAAAASWQSNNNQPEPAQNKAAKPKFTPRIIIKRKRRKTEEDEKAEKKTKESSSEDQKRQASNKKEEENFAEAKSGTTQAGIGTLLSGYGSSSDED